MVRSYDMSGKQRDKSLRQAGSVLSLRVSKEVRAVVDVLAGRLTVKRKRQVTLTDVLMEAIEAKARREGVPWPEGD
jgi:hypothetical protein